MEEEVDIISGVGAFERALEYFAVLIQGLNLSAAEMCDQVQKVLDQALVNRKKIY